MTVFSCWIFLLLFSVLVNSLLQSLLLIKMSTIFFCNYNKKSYTSRLVQLSFTFRHHMYIKVCQLVSFFPVFSHFELFSPSDFILIFLHFCCDGFINYRNSDIVNTVTFQFKQWIKIFENVSQFAMLMFFRILI